MSDYLFCISRAENPGEIEILVSRDDPRLQTFDALLRRKSLGRFRLEWTLPVVNGELSEAALRKALSRHRAERNNRRYTCDPMTARGRAVELTTLRPPAPSKGKKAKPGLLRRFISAA